MAGKSSGEKRMRKLIEQFLKFGVVGTIAFCIDYGVLMLLSQAFGVDPVLSAAVSFCVSVVFNYMASMRYVFTHREDMSRGREFVIFIVLSAVGLAINEICMAVGVARLGHLSPYGDRHQALCDGGGHGLELLQPQEVAGRRRGR